ncbi:MAG: polyphosphate polymerase domain-containing protein [Coriobacteriales bacterium]|nr:polyphosphate polymerase domain-containing protein [Coriobacteriales bacterium]
MAKDPRGNIFERKEKKYVIDDVTRSILMARIADKMVEDEYGVSKITSIYCDTADRYLINRSIEKPVYKEKLRVRFYGELKGDSRVFIEIKKKFKGVVYKRRLAVSAKAADLFLSGMDYVQVCNAHPLPNAKHAEESLSWQSLQIAREIKAFMDHYEKRYGPLVPSILVECERLAYKPASSDVQSDLRITFDKSIVCTDLLGSDGTRLPFAQSVALLEREESVMEIKAIGSYPMWLAKALSDERIYPQSFSKCGRGYERIYARQKAASAAPATQKIQTRQSASNASNDLAYATLFAKHARKEAANA